MTTKKLTRTDRRVFMTRVSCSSFRLLLLAFIPLCAFLGVARADIDQTFNFSGALSQPLNGVSIVTGQFTIDFATDPTNDSITDFFFTTPAGTISPASPGAASIMELQGVPPSPNAIFTDLSFGSNSQQLALFFESPLSAFSASSFYTAEVKISNGEGSSGLICIFTCSGAAASVFSSGTVTPVLSAVPEPRSALLLIGVLMFTVCVIRRKAKPVGSH